MPSAEVVPLIPLDIALTMEEKKCDKDPILFAAYNSNISDLTDYINANPGSGAKVYAPNNVTLLHRIAEGGNHRSLEAADLVFNNWPTIDVNLEDIQGRTALHFAVLSQQLKLVELLMQKGASPAIKDHSGANSLHLAAKNNAHSDIVDCILEKSGNGDLLRTLCNDETVLHIAAKSSAPTMLKYLLAKFDGDLSLLENSSADSPLYLVASREDSEDTVNCVEILLENLSKDVINKKSKADGNTALHVASKHCRLKVITVMVRHQQTNISVTNKNKETCLHSLAKVSHKHSNSLQCAEALILQSRSLSGVEKKKARFILKKADDIGSAISVAVKCKAIKVAQFLIKEHGNPEAILENEPDLLKEIYEKVPQVAIPMLDKTVEYIPSATGSDFEKINVDFGPLTGYDLNDTTEESKYIYGITKSSVKAQRKVLEHPVVRIYIEQKWKKLAVLNGIYTMLYFLWLFAYSILCYEVYPPECPAEVGHTANTSSANYTTLRIFRSLFFRKSERTENCEFNVAAARTMALILYGYSVFFFLQEGVKIVVSKNDFAAYRNIVNVLQWIRHLLVMINASSAFMEPENIPAFQYHLGSVLFGYAWMMSLYELTNIPSFALLLAVIIVTVKKYAKLLICFFPVLVAVVPALSRYVGKDRQYDYLPFGIIKNFILMTGEVEYKETFYDENGPDLRSSAIVGQFFILGSVFGIGLVLANVLTGIAVFSYEDLIKDAQFRTALMQLKSIHFVDSLIVWLYTMNEKLDFRIYNVTKDNLPTVEGIETEHFSEEIMQAVQDIATQASEEEVAFD